MTTTVPLTKGKIALVDEEDLPRIANYSWCAAKGKSDLWYAIAYVRGSKTGKRKMKMAKMHRIIANANPTEMVDHWDGNGLNNTRNNLRIATSTQNLANKRKSIGKTSRFKGVHWFKRAKLWQAYISKDGKRRSLRYFKNEEDAARAYDAAAVELFGEFARLNFPKESKNEYGSSPPANEVGGSASTADEPGEHHEAGNSTTLPHNHLR